jgi:hypothetical protein
MTDPFTFWLRYARLCTALGETWMNAGLTIAARSGLIAQALARGGPLPAAEMTRMIVEKQTAALAAASAAIAPYQRATRANARRLSRGRPRRRH